MELALKILCRFFFTLGRELTERRTTSPFYSKKSGCGNNYNFERRSWRLNGTMVYLGRRTGRARDSIAEALARTKDRDAQLRQPRPKRRAPEQATDFQTGVELFPDRKSTRLNSSHIP